MMDIAAIKSLLPHRYPFLMIDKVIDLVPRKRIVAIKNVTTNEEFFNGHFPHQPVMPGVLLIECMAQASGLVMLVEHKNRGKIPFFTGIDHAKFRQPVIPGDQLRIEIDVIRIRGDAGIAQGKAFVAGELVAEARLMFLLGPSDLGKTNHPAH